MKVRESSFCYSFKVDLLSLAIRQNNLIWLMATSLYSCLMSWVQYLGRLLINTFKQSSDLGDCYSLSTIGRKRE